MASAAHDADRATSHLSAGPLFEALPSFDASDKNCPAMHEFTRSRTPLVVRANSPLLGVADGRRTPAKVITAFTCFSTKVRRFSWQRLVCQYFGALLLSAWLAHMRRV